MSSSEQHNRIATKVSNFDIQNPIDINTALANLGHN